MSLGNGKIRTCSIPLRSPIHLRRLTICFFNGLPDFINWLFWIPEGFFLLSRLVLVWAKWGSTTILQRWSTIILFDRAGILATSQTVFFASTFQGLFDVGFYFFHFSINFLLQILTLEYEVQYTFLLILLSSLNVLQDTLGNLLKLVDFWSDSSNLRACICGPRWVNDTCLNEGLNLL